MDQPPTDFEPQASSPPQAVTPPFAHYQAGLRKRKHQGMNPAIWAAIGALGILLVLAVGYYVLNYTRDEFRTLNRFPVEEYLVNYETVLGSRFKADVVVDAELGGTLAEGRLYSLCPLHLIP